jgi:hypothetical protein
MRYKVYRTCSHAEKIYIVAEVTAQHFQALKAQVPSLCKAPAIRAPLHYIFVSFVLRTT